VLSKKILIAANSDLGFDQRLLRISRSLHRAGYQPELLGRLFLKSDELSKEAFPQSRISLRFQKGKLGYLELNFRLFSRLLSIPCDAICSVDLDTLPACWLAAKWKKVKLIHDAHEYMEEVPEVYNRPFTKKIWHWIARLFLPGVDLAYTVSKSLVEEFKKVYHKDFHLVRNIPEYHPPVKSKPDAPIDSGYWVFLGAVNRGRGLEEFIPHLNRTGRKLVILGDGDKMKDVKRLVKRLGLKEKVEFKGKLPAGEAAAILRNAWAGINLLTDEGLSYRYSLANKFFDYVHAGIPQICIRYPEYKKLMAQFEVGILSNMEPAEIIESMELISTEKNQRKFREEAINARRIWNWQSEEKKLIGLYDDLFGLPTGPDPEAFP
jgi:glycosyltransferase involved in cell wall biosynthesis